MRWTGSEAPSAAPSNPEAWEALRRDQDTLLTFTGFPAEHSDGRAG
jgi:hypothetical protein